MFYQKWFRCFFGYHARDTVKRYNKWYSKSVCVYCGKAFLISEPPFQIGNGVSHWCAATEIVLSKFEENKK
jgi:hypothetical protein